MRLRALSPIMLAFAALPAHSQTVATSPAPDRVAVTVYRDPNRQPEQAPNLRWLNGFALVSETRQVTLPAGETELRFEGVAGGIVPQSAIVTGLPEGIIERNRDAYLLSPATLLDRSLGRRVHLRRTSRATGVVREMDAIIRTGAGGAAVLETEGGFEALRCTGIPETPIYDQVPAGLSARPTLSVRARTTQPVTASVTLSYIASGFDWQANYVGTLSPDGTRLELFAWLTMANGDETGFTDAEALAVAGRLNRRHVPRQTSEGGPINLRCWPQGTTSDIDEERAEDIRVEGFVASRMAPPPPPPPPPPSPAAMVAQQEDLGDLKLYRIPERMTVAARSQKQVAMLQQPNVQVRMVYRGTFWPSEQAQAGQAQRVLVTRNRTSEGLGLPLPAGRLMLFTEAGGHRLLLGQGTIRDRAVGEDVEIELGSAPGVRTDLTPVGGTKTRRDFELVVTNDRAEPVTFEALLSQAGDSRITSPTRLGRRNGAPLWAVTVPANGRASLRYSLSSRGR